MASLVKKVEEQLQSNSELRGFVVILTDDAEATSKELKKLASEHKIEKLPLTVYEGQAGPPGYKIAKDAEVTVHLWVGTQVKANHSFAAGELDEKGIEAVVADIPKILK